MPSSADRYPVILLSRSEADPVDPSVIQADVSEITIAQYFQVAITTILVYDILITLDKEVKYFWRVPKKVIDCVFFLNRYVGVLGAVAFIFYNLYGESLALCNFATWTESIANWLTIISVDYILMIRVLAFYSLDKRLPVCLHILLVLEAIFKLVMVIYLGIIEKYFVGNLTENWTICDVEFTPSLETGLLDWLIPMVYGAILMVLGLYKAAGYWRKDGGFEGFRLVKILIRDQALYFMLVVACCLINIIDFKLGVTNAFVANVLGALGNPELLTILGSRMLFNLKEAAELGVHEGTNVRISTRTMSEINFAEPAIPQGEDVTRNDENDIEV